MDNKKNNFSLKMTYGFSVIELIVALTIMTIVVTIGFSAYSYTQMNYGKIKKRVDNELNANPEGQDVKFKRRFYETLISNEALPSKCEPNRNELDDCISIFEN